MTIETFSGLLNESGVPYRFKEVREIRKPDKLPDNPRSLNFSDEEVAYLDTLPVFEVDGQNMSTVEFPAGVDRAVMVDFNTGVPWLADTSGFDYPRYVMSINGYKSTPLPPGHPDNPILS